MKFVFQNCDEVTILDIKKGTFHTDWMGAAIDYELDSYGEGTVTLDISSQTMNVLDINDMIEFLKAVKEQLDK